MALTSAQLTSFKKFANFLKDEYAKECQTYDQLFFKFLKKKPNIETFQNKLLSQAVELIENFNASSTDITSIINIIESYSFMHLNISETLFNPHRYLYKFNTAPVMAQKIAAEVYATSKIMAQFYAQPCIHAHLGNSKLQNMTEINYNNSAKFSDHFIKKIGLDPEIIAATRNITRMKDLKNLARNLQSKFDARWIKSFSGYGQKERKLLSLATKLLIQKSENPTEIEAIISLIEKYSLMHAGYPLKEKVSSDYFHYQIPLYSINRTAKEIPTYTTSFGSKTIQMKATTSEMVCLYDLAHKKIEFLNTKELLLSQNIVRENSPSSKKKTPKTARFDVAKNIEFPPASETYLDDTTTLSPAKLMGQPHLSSPVIKILKPDGTPLEPTMSFVYKQ